MGSNTWSKQNQILQAQLKETRIKAGFTQLELAKKINKPQSYVSKYESGERRLDLIELRKIVLCCGILLNSFIKDFEQEMEKGI